MDSQKQKILLFLYDRIKKKQGMPSFDELKQITGSLSLSSSLLSELKKDDYTYINVDDKGIHFLSTEVFLTDKGVKKAIYLLKPIWQRFFIDLKSKLFQEKVIVAIFTVGIGLILNAVINYEEIEGFCNKYLNNSNINTKKLIKPTLSIKSQKT